MEINSYFIPLTLLFGSTIGLYYGYRYGKSYLQSYIISKVMEELNKKQEEEGTPFISMERAKSAVILYKHGGKEYKVCVPYDRTKSRAMLRKEVFLLSDNGKIDITHKPGVPYLLSAEKMGGVKIVVVKDNKTIREYDKDEIPEYLE